VAGGAVDHDATGPVVGEAEIGPGSGSNVPLIAQNKRGLTIGRLGEVGNQEYRKDPPPFGMT